MNNIPNVIISLTAEEQNLLLDAISLITSMTEDRYIPRDEFSALEIEQLLMVHNQIIQARVEQDPDFEPA